MIAIHQALLGARRVEKLYLELLFRCNFRCRTCYHGQDLDRPGAISGEQAIAALDYFATTFGCNQVCFLGGEPLLYDGLPALLDGAQARGYLTEICTNGYKRRSLLRECLPHLNLLRVSLDGGTAVVHDPIRHPHSFTEAFDTISWTITQGLPVGVTCTLTGENIATIPELALRLRETGVTEMMLHRVRLVGNAVQSRITEVTWEQTAHLYEQLTALDLGGLAINTEILLPARCHRPVDLIEKLEISPDGRVYLSCAEVGHPGIGLRYDFDQTRLVA